MRRQGGDYKARLTLRHPTAPPPHAMGRASPIPRILPYILKPRGMPQLRVIGILRLVAFVQVVRIDAILAVTCVKRIVPGPQRTA
jgi:hypothetical protein